MFAEVKFKLKSNLESLPLGIWRKLITLVYDVKQFLQTYLFSLSVKKKIRAHSKKIKLVGTFKSSVSHSFAAHLLEMELQEFGYQTAKIDISELVNAPLDHSSAVHKQQEIDADTLIFVINPDNVVNVIQDLGTEILKDKRIIGYWVWETDIPPKKWHKCNKLVHEIWTPSNYSARALARLFDKPIKIVPHPCAILLKQSPDKETKADIRRQFGLDSKDFCVIQSLSLSSSLARKNAIGSIKAFSRALGDRSDAKLLIRYYADSRHHLAEKRLVEAAKAAGQNVMLIKSSGKISELERLYAIADVYISLHRAEGFGLNIAEAMLAGIPVIATAETGNIDYMDSECAALISAEKVKVKDPDKIYKQKNAYWYEPNLGDAEKALLKLYEDVPFRNRIGSLGKEKALKLLKAGKAHIALKQI